MEQADFFFPLRKFAVRQGKQRPYLHTPSAASCESCIGLGKECRLFFHQFRFGHAGQTAHFQQYNTIVAFHPPFALAAASVLHSGAYAGKLVDMSVGSAAAMICIFEHGA